ncbi:hypothetical protein ACFLZ5_06040 [Thermodesulfobacteriota bacterium]
MKKSLLHVFSNQHGSVINVALLILILIFLIGIGLSKMSTTDIKIANNIKQDVTTFYEADTGLEETGEMIEQNLACPIGFKDFGGNGYEIIGGKFFFFKDNFTFARNERKKGAIPGVDPTDLEVSFFYPPEIVKPTYPPELADPSIDLNKEPHTTVSVGGASRFTAGSAIQMAAGYEGLGKGSAAGGSSIIYDVYAQTVGKNNTASTHFMQWVHLIIPLGDCNFD